MEEWLSPRFKELFGYEDHEIPNTSTWWQENIFPEDLQVAIDNFNKHCADPRYPYDQVVRYRHKDNTTVWVRCRGIAIRDETGKPIRMLGAHTDVTALRQANEKLKQVNEKLLQENKTRKRAEDALRSEQELLRHLICLQEEDRRMAAHDIHDGFLQYVQAAYMHLQTIGAPRNLEALETTTSHVGKLIRKAIDEGRRMISDLRPIVLDDEGIIHAVEHLIADFRTVAVVFDQSVQFDRLDPKLEGAIFRIIQEALNNVEKHGKTDHAVVELKQQYGKLDIVVQDQGVGFDLDKATKDRFGLRGIRERARLFGGTAKIESSPGEGTVIRVQLPMEPGT